MLDTQVAQTKLDEINRCKGEFSETVEDQNRYASFCPAVMGQEFLAQLGTKESPPKLEGLLHTDQKVFLPGSRSVGRISKLIPNPEGRVSYLVIRTSYLWGRYKILSVNCVGSITPRGVLLSIDREQFKGLSDYKTDAIIANEIDRALWNDEALRVIDYNEITVRVKNGIVSLTGHISGTIDLERIENAIKDIQGILGKRIHLVRDDKLLLEISEALAKIEHVKGNRFSQNVNNGVVVLSGEAVNANDRRLAEQYAASVPRVRGVINCIHAPGIDLNAEDQRFLQPSIGEEIYFLDGISGNVKQVIIHPNNRRVVSMILQGRFTGLQNEGQASMDYKVRLTKQLIVIPVNVIRYLTRNSGFLLIDSTETTSYQDFDPANFVAPEGDWVPPYPYCTDDVLFQADREVIQERRRDGR